MGDNYFCIAAAITKLLWLIFLLCALITFVEVLNYFTGWVKINLHSQELRWIKAGLIFGHKLIYCLIGLDPLMDFGLDFY